MANYLAGRQNKPRTGAVAQCCCCCRRHVNHGPEMRSRCCPLTIVHLPYKRSPAVADRDIRARLTAAAAKVS